MRSPERRTIRRLVAAVAGLAFVAAACGSDDEADEPADEPAETPADETEPEPGSASETTVSEPEPDPEPASETTAAAPEPEPDAQRVVSLSATHTEMMFAIGAGDQLVAVDLTSNFPPEALELPNDLDAFDPSVEAIAAYEPDLVLIGGDFNGLGDQLEAVDIAWWDGPPAASLEDTYAQIEQLGAATGRIAEAAELVSEMQTDIEGIVADVGGAGDGLSFYHEIDDTLFTADSSTFIGQLYSLLGLRNIADADESGSFGFPQLNAEFIVEQNPDLIFLPTGTFYLETAEGLAARPGWDAIAAVQNGNIVETSDEIAGRWGPRVVEYLRQVADAVQNVQVPTAADG